MCSGMQCQKVTHEPFRSSLKNILKEYLICTFKLFVCLFFDCNSVFTHLCNDTAICEDRV